MIYFHTSFMTCVCDQRFVGKVKAQDCGMEVVSSVVHATVGGSSLAWTAEHKHHSPNRAGCSKGGCDGDGYRHRYGTRQTPGSRYHTRLVPGTDNGQ